ncbi:hypothetical protein FPV67DRAFT_1426412 [Lyophyllum atratum]|nr:hypothetical protein FPV67DRAFT_1426412 [Lyophyllum atratum]
MFDSTVAPGFDPLQSRHRRKRANQSQRWLTEVIPALIPPYMEVLSKTQSLRLRAESELRCTCGSPGRKLDMVVLRFSTLESLSVQICECSPAAVQLMNRGLFPCSPVAPTLAVDLLVLDFVTRLFVHMPPNITAWCQTAEEFLGPQGYKLTTQDSLRRRFSNALQWYNTLQDATTKYVDSKLSQARQAATRLHDGAQEDCPSLEHDTNDGRDHIPTSAIPSPSRSSAPPAPSSNPRTPTRQATVEDVDDEETPVPLRTAPKRRRPAADLEDEHPVAVPSQPFPHPTPRERPSDYLRARCPLCFGGEFPRCADTDPDAIVCIDACFTQKRNKQARDPERAHPRTVFVPESDADRMAQYVERVRPPKAPKPPKRSRQQNDEVDKYEETLRVPKSVLDSCESGFTAADDARVKASTQFFDDTALMAMLCRHDRVLWIVNMRSAGEKQHYALVLIETLFQHLPLAFRIGLLYDIACQLERSCVLWKFLKRHINRISFAISVFHAFGHQWACQVIYHPQKCLGFGLSDGEGCERFWHSISKLIAYLRVCGYHQRIYTLDRQVQQADKQSLAKLANWLLRRSRHCKDKRQAAETALQEAGQTEACLRREWDAQVKAQTKPLPRRSKNQGKNAVEEAIRLRKARDILQQRVTNLEDEILDPSADTVAISGVEAQLAIARPKLHDTELRLKHQERALGVDDRAELIQLLGNSFIAARMNALALKVRLCERLRARKFEMDRVERSFRKQVNEQKIHAHTEASVRRRDPSVQQLARDYNKLCKTMASLITADKAPTPPLWLSDDGVRSGIKARLELDRCTEEEARLRHERRTLQFWFQEETLLETI